MFPERLKELRKDKGISQYKLADELKVTRGNVSQFECGTREPNIQMICNIARYFNVTTDYLLGMSDDK